MDARKAEPASLQADFESAFAVFRGNGSIDDLYAFFDDAGFMIDEDVPFLLDKAQFREHLGFHLSGVWSKLEWIAREPRFDVWGTTGVVSAYFTLRGKPRDAGFRLRHGLCTVGCYWDGQRWRGATLNLDPLSGHIEDASPT
jgi:hypothetical protein